VWEIILLLDEICMDLKVNLAASVFSVEGVRRKDHQGRRGR
jgi:hypothetical protein